MSDSDIADIDEIQDLPFIMTPEDIAKVLRISRNKAYEVVHSKDFPCFKIGKQYRIKRERFIQWLDKVTAA